MNTWAALTKILSNKTLQIAKIIGYNENYHVVETENGSIFDVKSEVTYSIGDNVFIEGDRITNKAPTLNHVEVEI